MKQHLLLTKFLQRQPLARSAHQLASAQQGQSLVLIAGFLIAILGLAALVIDGGLAYATRRKMQNAADAGSIAGARELALGATDSQINSEVQDYTVTKNGAAGFNATYYPGGERVGGGTVPASAQGVVVTATVTFDTFFAPLLGQPHVTVPAGGGAAFGGASEPGPSLQPLARKCTHPKLDQCGFQYDQSYDIWQGGGPGNFGWLSWDGGQNAPYLARELRPGNDMTGDYTDPHGNCTQIAVGCWVQGYTGITNKSEVRNELDTWIGLGQQVPPVPMVVIIYDQSELGGSNTNYHIKGFAAFVVESYILPNGNGGGSVIGQFKKWMVSAPIDGSGDQYGVFSVHVIE